MEIDNATGRASASHISDQLRRVSRKGTSKAVATRTARQAVPSLGAVPRPGKSASTSNASSTDSSLFDCLGKSSQLGKYQPWKARRPSYHRQQRQTSESSGGVNIPLKPYAKHSGMTARKSSKPVRRVVLISSSEDESMRVVGSAGQAQSRPRPAPAAARKRKRGSSEVIVESPAPRRARQSTTNTSQDTIFAETPGRFWADRPPARAANLGSFQDARSASASSQRVVMPPPTAIALLEARLARSKLCSPKRLYADMPYLDTESDLSDTESLMD